MERTICMAPLRKMRRPLKSIKRQPPNCRWLSFALKSKLANISKAQSSTAMLLRHLFLAKGIVPPFFAVLGKVISGWPHLLSPADCPCRWRSCGLECRDTRHTCSTDPCGTACDSDSSGTPEMGRPRRCRSGRYRACPA